MAKLCEWFFLSVLRNDKSRGDGVVLTGGTGTGKTASMARVKSAIQAWAVTAKVTEPGWSKGFPYVCWLDWSSVAEDRARFDDGLADAREAAVVFLDDVGAEADRFKNGEPASRLRRLLSECERKWLMVTTNVPRAELGTLYDARTADRLSRAHWCDLSEVPSYRPKLK